MSRQTSIDTLRLFTESKVVYLNYNENQFGRFVSVRWRLPPPLLCSSGLCGVSPWRWAVAPALSRVWSLAAPLLPSDR